MSDYCKKKVLRIPWEYTGLNWGDYADDTSFDLWNKFGDMFYLCGNEVGRFQLAPCVRRFIDYVLEDDYGYDCGEWGKVRELYPQEIDKYKDVFQKLCPTIDMSKVKLVEFCWYNCSEAPDYYDPTEDEFYKEVPFICNFT